MTQRPNLRLLQGPLGPYRGKRVVTTHATIDHEDANGFTCQLGTAGDIVYRDMYHDFDQTETGLAAGDMVAVKDVPVILIAVRSLAGGTTVTSLVLGIL